MKQPQIETDLWQPNRDIQPMDAAHPSGTLPASTNREMNVYTPMRIVEFISAGIVISALLCHPAEAQVLPYPGNCEHGTTESFLDVGNVRAKLEQNGALFWNGGGGPSYEVPRGSGHVSLFSGALWVGAKSDDSLRVSASTFGPFELWPGPVSAAQDGSCAAFDRIWMLDRNADESERATQIAEWPGHLGAPFLDVNGLEGYQPSDGDRPLIRGDQTAWWIMNDLGNTTFYNFVIHNKSVHELDSLFLAFWSDVDVGDPFDDMFGSDTSRGMVFAYNKDTNDNDEYGVLPPAIGFTPLEYVLSDMNQAPFGILPRFTNTVGHGEHNTTGDPQSALDFYRYMQSIWKNGQHMTMGGGGLDGTEETNFSFPGDPVGAEFWSGFNTDGHGSEFVVGDIRMLGSMGPAGLGSMESVSFTVAVVWAQGADNLDSIVQLRTAARFIRENAATYVSSEPISTATEEPTTIVQRLELYPNPAIDFVTIQYDLPRPAYVRIDMFDALGRRVRTPADGFRGSGEHISTLDTSRLVEGVYFVRFQSDTTVRFRTLSVH